MWVLRGGGGRGRVGGGREEGGGQGEERGCEEGVDGEWEGEAEHATNTF